MSANLMTLQVKRPLSCHYQT